MARHGENIRIRKDGRWEGRYKVFDESRGKCIYHSVYGRDYGEVKEKLLKARIDAAWCDNRYKLCQEDFVGIGRNTIKIWNGTRAASSDKVTENVGGIRISDDAVTGNAYVRKVPTFGGAPIFSQLAHEWLADIYRKRKYSTYIKYETICRTHLAGIIGSCRLSANNGQELYERVRGHLSEEGMSESLQTSVISVTNQILAFANEHYHMHLSPLKHLPVKVKRKPAETFSLAEQARLLDAIYAKLDRFMIGVLLAIQIGLRLGEVCALKWTDIDFNDGTLAVNRTVQRVSIASNMNRTALLETDPKSDNSKRTIPLPPELIDLLEWLWNGGSQSYATDGNRTRGDSEARYCERGEARPMMNDEKGSYATDGNRIREDGETGNCERGEARPMVNDSEHSCESSERRHHVDAESQPYVFGGEKPLDPRTMQYRFKMLLRKAHIKNGTFHRLRHTFATNCIENGMDVKTLSELLGHSDVKITMNRYVHPTMDSKRKQLSALSDFYGQICGKTT